MAYGEDLRNKRSAVPRVLGVASIILSLPFLVMVLLSTVSSERMVGYGRTVVREIHGPLGKSYRVEINGRKLKADAKLAASALFVGKLITTLFGALSLLLFVAAIGQLKYRSWGRILTLTWAFLSLCFILLLLMMLTPELSLRVRDVAEHALRGRFHAAEAMTRLPSLWLGITATVLAIYPTLCLFFFILPHTKASMR